MISRKEWNSLALHSMVMVLSDWSLRFQRASWDSQLYCFLNFSCSAGLERCHVSHVTLPSLYRDGNWRAFGISLFISTALLVLILVKLRQPKMYGSLGRANKHERNECTLSRSLPIENCTTVYRSSSWKYVRYHAHRVPEETVWQTQWQRKSRTRDCQREFLYYRITGRSLKNPLSNE